MSDVIKFRMGGYGPPTTTHSRGLKFIGDALEAQFGDRVDVKYVWNVMDFGYRTDDLPWLTEAGILTLCYQSTSNYSDRVPAFNFVDLPFLFPDLETARAAYEGALGKHLAGLVEAEYNFRVLGFFENGFRHISNRLRPVHRPEDLKGMSIRMLTSDMHERTFRMLGCEPRQMDLAEAIETIKAGGIDAQENPLANTVTYGVYKFHPYHTLTGHFYLSRGLWANRDAVDSWPDDIRTAMYETIIPAAIAHQRKLAVEEEAISRKVIEDEGCEIVELTPDEHDAFVTAVMPLHGEAREMFGDEMFDLLPK